MTESFGERPGGRATQQSLESNVQFASAYLRPHVLILLPTSWSKNGGPGYYWCAPSILFWASSSWRLVNTKAAIGFAANQQWIRASVEFLGPRVVASRGRLSEMVTPASGIHPRYGG